MPFVLYYPDHETGWHVYGLLQRSDKKYDEAIKCYRNALKWDKVSWAFLFLFSTTAESLFLGSITLLEGQIGKIDNSWS